MRIDDEEIRVMRQNMLREKQLKLNKPSESTRIKLKVTGMQSAGANKNPSKSVYTLTTP